MKPCISSSPTCLMTSHFQIMKCFRKQRMEGINIRSIYTSTTRLWHSTHSNENSLNISLYIFINTSSELLFTGPLKWLVTSLIKVLGTRIEVGEVKYNFGLFWINTEVEHIWSLLLLPPAPPVEAKAIDVVLFESNRQLFLIINMGKILKTFLMVKWFSVFLTPIFFFLLRKMVWLEGVRE